MKTLTLQALSTTQAANDIHTMTNFSPSEFNVLWADFRTYYGHKVEVSVLPNGFAINSTAHYKGSVSDKAIFDDNSFTCLPYQATEDRIADHGDEGTNQWAVIADKVYQGIQRVVRVVLPKKKPAGGILTLEDIRSNDRIASDV
ncbi:hypothetical protein B5M09_008468 [Aphanomyces astaci]|uniref:DDE Tnp4 domain-containing protein n=1 Tax=Aphanomyces astaci TaxID=112090 RepID=A0A3R7ZEP7_APHAT|nr:hypothetical protein B5M09_008468 [Aphanomyces astaci]